jgi:cell division septation protein DedD
LLLTTTAPARADFAAGAAAYDAGDDATAMREWAPLAELGDADAQFALGTLYESGRGVPAVDLEQAVTWYRAAAAQGLPAAQNNLALLYAGGRGVSLNPFTAAELWHKAAAAGHPSAQFNLALAYERGLGLPRDYDSAARWYAEAGNHGVADAAFAISELYRTGRGVPQHDELATLWLEVARKFGSSLALREDFISATPTGSPKPAMPAPPADTAASEPPAAVPAKTTAATPPPAEPPTPAVDPAGAFAVQLASLASEAEASHIGDILKSKHADLLGKFDLIVRRADLGAEKGVWYRILAGPFAARDAATQLCSRLRAAPKPADCLVVAIK